MSYDIPTFEFHVDIGDGWLAVAEMGAEDIDCWCGIDAITENAEVPVRIVEQYGKREEIDERRD